MMVSLAKIKNTQNLKNINSRTKSFHFSSILNQVKNSKFLSQINIHLPKLFLQKQIRYINKTHKNLPETKTTPQITIKFQTKLTIQRLFMD